jgi:hypothetical protein
MRALPSGLPKFVGDPNQLTIVRAASAQGQGLGYEIEDHIDIIFTLRRAFFLCKPDDKEKRMGGFGHA